MSADDTSHETAMKALGLLTNTFQDGHIFGPVTSRSLRSGNSNCCACSINAIAASYRSHGGIPSWPYCSVSASTQSPITVDSGRDPLPHWRRSRAWP